VAFPWRPDRFLVVLSQHGRISRDTYIGDYKLLDEQ
jgi:hypothetical protein